MDDRKVIVTTLADTNVSMESNLDSQRKLASVQIVEFVKKPAKADKLELVTIRGMAWQVIEVKGVVQPGDKVVYCEIDSLLPGTAKWLPEAVRKRVDKQLIKDFYRIKTVRLCNEWSQGLIIPFRNFLEDFPDCNNWIVGDDVTQLLGISKYEPNLVSNVNGPRTEAKFPTHFLSKTDEIRIQNNPSFLENMRGHPYYITVKCDGTSGTFMIDPETDVFMVCSRNYVRGEFVYESESESADESKILYIIWKSLLAYESWLFFKSGDLNVVKSFIFQAINTTKSVIQIDAVFFEKHLPF